MKWFFFLFVVFTSCKTPQPAASPQAGRDSPGATQRSPKILSSISIPHHPLQGESDLDLLLKEIGNARIVLLGEASHGSLEFYYWRTVLTQRLIKEKGFDQIAVEGDWNEARRINDFIKGEKKDSDAVIALLRQNKRWPTWIWANREVAVLVNWLNEYNQHRSNSAKIGFYGLDLFTVGESLKTILSELQDTASLNAAKKATGCFTPFADDALLYALAVHERKPDCSQVMEQLWQTIEKNQSRKPGEETAWQIEQNARVAFDGERYFRAMAFNRTTSWNIRDWHMMEIIRNIRSLHGRNTKIIIWAHNTHVGDARYSDMAVRGKTNLGELLRMEYGDQHIFILGFGSYAGSVLASEKWGGAMQTMQLPPAFKGSWEALLHESGPEDQIILSKDLRADFIINRWIDQRSVGVLYHPDRERSSYTSSFISRRYDAFIFIDQSHALHPLKETDKGSASVNTYAVEY